MKPKLSGETRTKQRKAGKSVLPEALENNFPAFVAMLWEHKGFDPPTAVQIDIAEFLQNGQDRRFIGAFRGAAKTELTIAYALWRLAQNPALKVLILSASSKHAIKLSNSMRGVVREWDVLAGIRPGPDHRDSVHMWDVGGSPVGDKDPSVNSAGVTSNLPGARADLIICDDVEVPSNSETVDQREKLKERVKETSSIILPGGEIVFLGTYQNAESIYLELPAKGYDVRLWPAKFPSLEDMDHYEGLLAAWVMNHWRESRVGVTTEPKRFSNEILAQKEIEEGKQRFALQYMMRPNLKGMDAYPLKCKDLIVSTFDSEYGPNRVPYGGDYLNLPCPGLKGDRFRGALNQEGAPIKFMQWERKVLAVDPSGKGRDRTAIAILYLLNGLIFVREWIGMEGGYDAPVLEKIARLAKSHAVHEVLVEENFGMGMFATLLSPYLSQYHPCSIESVRQTKQKEQRICDTLEPLLGMHRVIVHEDVVTADHERIQDDLSPEDQLACRGFYQLSHITRDKGCLKWDDSIDCLAMGAQYLQDCVQDDPETLAKMQLDEEIDNEIWAVLAQGPQRQSQHKTWQSSIVGHGLSGF